MSKEKQIEEMVKVIQKSFDDSYYGGYDPDAEITAEDLWNAGYRKQAEGEWISPTTIGGRAFNVPHCSVCNGIPCGVDANTKFCPNCGAKMGGE